MYKKVCIYVIPDRIVRLLLQHLQEIARLAAAVNTPNNGGHLRGNFIFTSGKHIGKILNLGHIIPPHPPPAPKKMKVLAHLFKNFLTFWFLTCWTFLCIQVCNS